ncbi:MAG: hypothetical protein FXF49_10085 [Flexistipes sinusarabici]|uniref:Uncharacterized protein n=1 Tax=Flexistipes sinusarabici TaxID=2352 RepID=A0A5D0MIB4_FLESI|nr:hypothetical protein [Flexistipes sinusarabici]TYB32716.1 MAG: hypothetical protein FXF49_10085 [Flexistipes sinusarabici]
MKSKDINSLVFVNPSPNLYKISRAAADFGSNVEYLFTDELPEIRADELFYFDKNRCFRTNLPGVKQNSKDKHVYSFKSGIFKRNVIKRHICKLCDKSLFPNANYVDIQMMAGHTVKESLPELKASVLDNFEEVIRNMDPSKLYITGWLPYFTYKNKLEKLYLSAFKTDFDAKKCFGRDYVVFFSDYYRVEIFVKDDILYTVGKLHKHILDKLKTKLPFLKKFEYEEIYRSEMSRNCYPWAVNVTADNLLIINDYSYFGHSAQMPEDWYQKAGRYLCTGIQL